MDREYEIDYDMFNVMELMAIFKFFKMVEQYKAKKTNKDEMISTYREYQRTLNNKTLEKQYDKMLFKKSRVSIYKLMKKLIG